MRPPYFRGEWLTADDPAYEIARPVWNRRTEARPAVIARCAGVSDVMSALAYARESNLPVDVRATGVTFGGIDRSRGVVIDLSPMRGVQILPEQRIARVQGGIRGGDLQIEAGLHGLGAVTGVVSTVGLGLMLGGGLGTLTPRVGYAADNIVSAEVVTASGEVVTASPQQNADLFWALRGSTGNFGVVTTLEVLLHEVPPAVQVGMWHWDLDNVEGPVRALRERDWADDGLCLIGLLAAATPDSPAGLDMLVCHTGPHEVATADIERLRSFGAPDAEAIPVSAMPFYEASFLFDEVLGPMRGALDEQPVAAFSDELVEALVATVREPAGGATRWIELVPPAAALARPPEFPSALRETALEPSWGIGPGALWGDSSDDAVNDRWVESVMAAVRRIGPVVDHRHPAGVGVELDADAVARMYGDRYDRLREIKRRWDPENVFAGAHNIPPAIS